MPIDRRREAEVRATRGVIVIRHILCNTTTTATIREYLYSTNRLKLCVKQAATCTFTYNRGNEIETQSGNAMVI